jgi:hypothetical protein
MTLCAHSLALSRFLSVCVCVCCIKYKNFNFTLSVSLPLFFARSNQVMIMDDGEPQLSSTTRVVIKVEDVNDCAPEFDQKTYNVKVPSNAKLNQKLFQVWSRFFTSRI